MAGIFIYQPFKILGERWRVELEEKTIIAFDDDVRRGDDSHL